MGAARSADRGLLLLATGVIGEAVTADAATAVWDVSGTGWSSLMNRPISAIHLHHALWDPQTSEKWLPRLSIHFGGDVVEVFLGQGRFDGLEVEPSVDNIAVMFNPPGLPRWIKGLIQQVRSGRAEQSRLWVFRRRYSVVRPSGGVGCWVPRGCDG